LGEYEIQNPQEVMIRLLARVALKPEEVWEIVAGSRRDKSNWVKAYNLCDGEHSKQADIAKEAAVNEGNFSSALKDWERQGILLYVKNQNGDICPQGIVRLDEKGKS